MVTVSGLTPSWLLLSCHTFVTLTLIGTTSVVLLPVLFSVRLDFATTILVKLPTTVVLKVTLKLALSPIAKTPSRINLSPIRFQLPVPFE